MFCVRCGAWRNCQKFKQWNIQALRTLARMGFDFPLYMPQREKPPKSEAGSSITLSERESDTEHKTQLTRICTILSPVMERLRGVLGLEELHKRTFDSLRDVMEISDMCSEKQIDRAVDNHMMVNNTVVDNEFNGAELPCGLDFSFRRNVAPTSRFFVSNFLGIESAGGMRRAMDCFVFSTVRIPMADENNQA